MNRITKYLVNLKNNNPWLLLLWHKQLWYRGKRDLRKNNDIEVVKKRHYSVYRKYPDLNTPKTFSDKIQWLKLNYHDPLMSRCADKYEVRKYIREKGYGDILNELIDDFDDIKDINTDKLPEKFVIKASHGSGTGWIKVVQDKKDVNWLAWKKIMKHWLKSNIYWLGREWVYKDLKPRVIIEKYLEDTSGELMDYKFFCFNGKPEFIQTNTGRFSDKPTQNYYGINWELLPFGMAGKEPDSSIIINKPNNFKKMIDISTVLAKDFPFVRVDFYDVEGKVIFGELTFYPFGGTMNINPQIYEEEIGNLLILPKKNTNL